MRYNWLLSLLLIAPGLATGAPRLVLVTEEYPPYNMSNDKGEVVGISTAIVKAMMTEVGYDCELSIYPWSRAITLARTQVNTCVFSMSRTPEREALYKWIGPLVFNDWSLFGRSGESRPARMEDVQNMHIGSYQGDAIVTYLQSRGYFVDVAPSDNLNPKKLQAGRIDYWATGRLIGQYRLRQQGVTDIEPMLTFNHSEMFLACQKQLPDTQVDLLQKALKELERRGAIKAIYASYGYTP